MSYFGTLIKVKNPACASLQNLNHRFSAWRPGLTQQFIHDFFCNPIWTIQPINKWMQKHSPAVLFGIILKLRFQFFNS